MKLNTGATLFSALAHPNATNVVALIEFALKIGLTNLQFLLDKVSDADIKVMGQMCRVRGITPITIGVMFHPTCPTGDATAARAYVLETARKARILSGDSARYDCIVTGPILRGLCHPVKGGLPLPADRDAQVAFLRDLAPELRKIPRLKFGIEPLNRTEAASLNTVGEVASVIDDAAASDVFWILADLFHMHLSELEPVADVLRRYKGRIVQIHLSEVNRCSIKLGRAVTRELLQLLADEFADILITMESFTTETDPGFYGPLMVNTLPDVPAFNQFEADYQYILSL